MLTAQVEKIVQFVASLPETSKLQDKLTAALITNLWNVLQHPPLSYVGDKYQYRDPAGRYNVLCPPWRDLISEHHVS
jgi:linoleate 10R-lipoxygenase